VIFLTGRDFFLNQWEGILAVHHCISIDQFMLVLDITDADPTTAQAWFDHQWEAQPVGCFCYLIWTLGDNCAWMGNTSEGGQRHRLAFVAAKLERAVVGERHTRQTLKSLAMGQEDIE